MDTDDVQRKEQQLTKEIERLKTELDEKTLLDFTRSHDFVVKTSGQSIHGLKKGYWEGKQDEVIALIGSK